MVKYLDDVVGGVHMVNTLIWRGLRDDLFVTSNDNGGPITFDAGAKNYIHSKEANTRTGRVVYW